MLCFLRSASSCDTSRKSHLQRPHCLIPGSCPECDGQSDAQAEQCGMFCSTQVLALRRQSDDSHVRPSPARLPTRRHPSRRCNLEFPTSFYRMKHRSNRQSLLLILDRTGAPQASSRLRPLLSSTAQLQTDRNKPAKMKAEKTHRIRQRPTWLLLSPQHV